jgi:hypothetical protein
MIMNFDLKELAYEPIKKELFVDSDIGKIGFWYI